MKPAANGQKCIIPFIDNNQEYYHCTNFGTSCLTLNGMSKCFDGKFFYSKSGALNTPYVNELTLPTINLPTANSDFVARFYLLVYCNNPDCFKAGDKIMLRIVDGENLNEDLIINSYLIEDFAYERRWMPYEIRFKSVSTKINVMRI